MNVNRENKKKQKKMVEVNRSNGFQTHKKKRKENKRNINI